MGWQIVKHLRVYVTFREHDDMRGKLGGRPTEMFAKGMQVYVNDVLAKYAASPGSCTRPAPTAYQFSP
jgi:hypothetical protein